jgi:ABC-type transporter Mla subunit MlaD
MSTDDQRDLIMVPVKRYDVTLSMDDILGPLTQTADNLNKAGLVSDPSSEVAQHLQTFTDLVNQLAEVTRRINELDASLLVSKAGPPPIA